MSDPNTDPAMLKAGSEIILRDFEIEGISDKDQMTEQELFDLLAEQIDFMIQHRLEHLFSLLYRMDVKEELVRAAMAPQAPEAANIGIAKLVLNRQKQRNFTKATIKPEDLGEEWDW